ncbi:MAG: TetR/AcrR family transcriptional regulator [Candidatus Aminicenantes bacterium]|nr:TetR/AcrR family transcriptional regulator [Candidatus Aminicenantes bacterium]
MKQKDTNSKQRILEAALKEFSSHGYSGARMETIAQKANINKAMIFYYYSSKNNLYQEVLRTALVKIFIPVSKVIAEAVDPESFIEKTAGFYVSFFTENQDFIHMVAFDLVQNPENLSRVLSAFFKNNFAKGPGLIKKKIVSWYEEGFISESDPVHFMLNIVSLSLLSFLGRPIIGSIFQMNLDEKKFIRQRRKSVINVLKKGMLR